MKKMFKIVSFLTTLSVFIGGTSVNATETTTDEQSTTTTTTTTEVVESVYDIDNEAYRQKVDSLGEKIAYEEEFVAYLNKKRESLSDIDIEDRAVTHVYNAYDYTSDNRAVNTRLYYVESIVPNTDKKARKFEKLHFYWGGSDFDEYSYPFLNWDAVYSIFSAEEINAFLEEENYKARIVKDSDGRFNVVHYDDTSEENIVSTFLALNKKFKAELRAYPPNMEDIDIFYDLTLLGDANGDNELNVSDCAFIARALAKRETIDIALNPAADYNNDGKVTVSDAATIARELAKKGE